MIPAHPEAGCPVSQADQILNKCRLLERRATSSKPKRRRGVGIKIGSIGDHIAELLVQKRIIRLHADLPFLPTMVYGYRPLEIHFPKIVVEKSDDRRGKRIRCESIRVVPHHSP